MTKPREIIKRKAPVLGLKVNLKGRRSIVVAQYEDGDFFFQFKRPPTNQDHSKGFHKVTFALSPDATEALYILLVASGVQDLSHLAKREVELEK